MCRFVLYMGPPITIDLLTTRPAYSIIQQSFGSRMSPEPLNGDGFGVAWYVPELSAEPGLFRSIQPAWNNMNLKDLARVSKSGVILAHVRAASPGLRVSESNCHPFTSGRLSMMHNGTVQGFPQLKRRFQQRLTDKAFNNISGTTDSEHLFALFQDKLTQELKISGRKHVEAMADALEATLRDVAQMTADNPLQIGSILNVAVSDGACSVVSRCATAGREPHSLYIITGRKYACENGECLMLDADGHPQAVLIASEPLTDEPGWRLVPENHMVLVGPGCAISFRPLAMAGVAQPEPARAD